MISSLALSMTLAATTFVPPGEPVADHSQPYHSTQPVIRTFQNKPTDDLRRMSWNDYCQAIDKLWKDYRAAGSTPEAWQQYKGAVEALKLDYIFRDPWYAPIPH